MTSTRAIATAVGMMMLLLAAGTALAAAVTIEPDLSDFRDVRRSTEIGVGSDLGDTHHEALNFTGSAGAAGDTWITVYDPAVNPLPATFGTVRVTADVLIHAYNNKKGAGVLALYNEAPSKKGLALILYSAGNTDSLVLATVDQAGKLVTLKTVGLGAAIVENTWYRVDMDVEVTGGLVSVLGAVFSHQTPANPDSALGPQVGAALDFPATLLGVGALAGLDATGEVGVLSAAFAAANASSVTNVVIELPVPMLECAPPTQTVAIGATATVGATGGTGTYSWSAPGGSTPTGTGASFSTSYAAAGTQTITVTSGAETATCEVVVQPFSCLSLSPSAC